MPLKIEIPDGQVSVFKEIYSKRYTELVNTVNTANKELEEMRPILLQLDIISAPKVEIEIPGKAVISTDTYNTNWGWLDKCMFVMKRYGASTPQQIIEKLVSECEPDLNREDIVGSIPSTLSVEARKPEGSKLIRYKKEGEREYRYDIKK